MNLTHTQPVDGPEASCPGTTKQGDQFQEPVTPICDAYEVYKFASADRYVNIPFRVYAFW